METDWVAVLTEAADLVDDKILANHLRVLAEQYVGEQPELLMESTAIRLLMDMGYQIYHDTFTVELE